MPEDSEPLDLMTYFVDERLMEMAENEEPDYFFREYMAGFVISKRESLVSHCGAQNISSLKIIDGLDGTIEASRLDLRDLMCAMLTTTPVVRTEELFTDSIKRLFFMNSTSHCFDRSVRQFFDYRSTINCLLSDIIYGDYQFLNPSLYPICNDTILNEHKLMLTQDITHAMIVSDDFKVDGDIRQTTDDISVDLNPTVARLYAPFGDPEATGATVYYNNQVTFLL